MVTFAICPEHSSLQLNTAFFLFTPKKEKNDIYCVRGKIDYKIKNNFKPDQIEFLIEFTQTCTYPKHLEFLEQHAKTATSVSSATMITVLNSPFSRPVTRPQHSSWME